MRLETGEDSIYFNRYLVLPDEYFREIGDSDLIIYIAMGCSGVFVSSKSSSEKSIGLTPTPAPQRIAGEMGD